jgi:lysophospholipase L1-like esterase
MPYFFDKLDFVFDLLYNILKRNETQGDPHMKILFQGDSITDGNRYKSKASAWDKNHQIGHSYVYIITGLLGMKYPERHLEFINKGISGNQASNLLARWDEDCLAIKPDVLSILVGINDCFFASPAGRSDLSATAYEENYRRLLTLAREKNPALKLVLLEPFAHIEGQQNSAISATVRTAILRSEQKIARKLAKEFDAIFVPLQEKFDEAMQLREPSYWIWDGTHPTEAGHAIIAREWLKATADIFEYTI